MRIRTVLAIIISLAVVFGAVEAAIYLAHHNSGTVPRFVNPEG